MGSGTGLAVFASFFYARGWECHPISIAPGPFREAFFSGQRVKLLFSGQRVKLFFSGQRVKIFFRVSESSFFFPGQRVKFFFRVSEQANGSIRFESVPTFPVLTRFRFYRFRFSRFRFWTVPGQRVKLFFRVSE